MKIKPQNALDLYNLRTDKTQVVKSIKITESVYNVLHDMKKHNPEIRTLSDGILLGLLALAGQD